MPFALPDVGDAEAQAVAEVIRSGWVTSGPAMRAFEQEFAAFVGSPQAVAVNSATGGLHLALEALGIGPGDEVIVPDWTFTATAEVVRYLGATPVIVDVERATLNIAPAAVAAAVTARTRAVIPVHFAGLAVDEQALLDALGGRDVAIVEDAAHALPASAGGELVGGSQRSAATVFSFYATKTITTGEGGMITPSDPRIAARTRVMRLHGIDRDAFNRYTSSHPAWAYDVVAPGFKYNMPDTAAQMGRVQLQRAHAMRDRRQRIADYYSEELQDLPLHLPAGGPAGWLHAWHLYVVRLHHKARLDRDGFIAGMAQQGVGTSVHFIPLHQHSYWQPFAPDPEKRLPVAVAEAPWAVSLPISSGLSDGQIEHVVAAAKALLA